MMRKILILTTLLLFLYFSSYGQRINISIFHSYDIKKVRLSVKSGKLAVIGDNNVVGPVRKGEELLILKTPDSLEITMERGFTGKYADIELYQAEAETWEKMFFLDIEKPPRTKVDPVIPDKKPRVYDDGFKIRPAGNHIQLINFVDFDKYLAGVVETESGFRAEKRFYKAQAVLARTYAMKHIDRHEVTGFNLCDQVHCQAYKGRRVHNPDILKAVRETSHEVVVDKNGKMIEAVFCANCGGETENPVNVWSSDVSYLKAVNDPYCKSSDQYQWRKSIPLDKWIRYFKRYSYTLAENIPPDYFTSRQDTRHKFYNFETDSIPYVQLRRDWKLRSAFFSVLQKKDVIQLKGRGYGHGIGMCQEGAIEMAERGFSYEEIINFYYNNVSIVERELSEESNPP